MSPHAMQSKVIYSKNRELCVVAPLERHIPANYKHSTAPRGNQSPSFCAGGLFSQQLHLKRRHIDDTPVLNDK